MRCCNGYPIMFAVAGWIAALCPGGTSRPGTAARSSAAMITFNAIANVNRLGGSPRRVAAQSVAQRQPGPAGRHVPRPTRRRRAVRQRLERHTSTSARRQPGIRVVRRAGLPVPRWLGTDPTPWPASEPRSPSASGDYPPASTARCCLFALFRRRYPYQIMMVNLLRRPAFLRPSQLPQPPQCLDLQLADPLPGQREPQSPDDGPRHMRRVWLEDATLVTEVARGSRCPDDPPAGDPALGGCGAGSAENAAA